MDTSVIPKGNYCYGVKINDNYKNIPYTTDIPYFTYYDKVICPYWNNIKNGLIECKYLSKLTLNLEDSDCENKSLKYFNGDESKVKECNNGYQFWDKVKDCKFYGDLDVSVDFELISDEKYRKIEFLKGEE